MLGIPVVQGVRSGSEESGTITQGSFLHPASEGRQIFNMALPVPKTMFQHMLKEGAKVCMDV